MVLEDGDGRHCRLEGARAVPQAGQPGVGGRRAAVLVAHTGARAPVRDDKGARGGRPDVAKGMPVTIIIGRVAGSKA
jgi:hypothetical protein